MNPHSRGRGDLIRTNEAGLNSDGSSSLLGVVLLLLLTAVGLNSLSPTVRLVGTASVATSLGAWWAWRGLLARSLHFRPNAVVSVLAVSLIVQALSLSWTPFPHPAAEAFLQNALLFLLFLTVTASLSSGWSDETWQASLLVLAGAFALVEILIFGIWLTRWWGIEGVETILPPIGYRSSGLILGHPNVLSGYLTLLLPLLIARIVQAPRRSQQIGWSAFFLLLGPIQFFTSSRGGWLASVAGLGVTIGLLILGRYRRSREGLRMGEVKDFLRRRAPLLAGISTLVFTLVALGLWQVSRTGHAPLGDSRIPVWEGALTIAMQAPLRGSGLRSFAPLYSQLPLAFRIEDIPHAHNLLLQMWVEGGLAQVILTLVATAMVGWRGLLRFQSVEPRSLPRIAGLLGALAAIVSHNMVDYLFGHPLYTAACLVALALLLEETSHGRPLPDRIDRASATAVVAVALITVVAQPVLLKGSWSHWEGVAAAREGDWDRAASLLCSDPESVPRSAVYSSACGISREYAHALNSATLMAESDGGRPLRAAVEHDPHWHQHWLNLATLQGRNGDWSDAVHHMERAYALVPQSSTTLLNLGYALESAGKEEEARARYREALTRNPWLEDAAFFDGSNLRIEAREVISTVEISNTTNRLLLAAKRALQRQDESTAADRLSQAAELAPASARLHSIQSRRHLANGELAEARRAIQTARFIGGDSPSSWAVEAQISLAEGDGDRAYGEIVRALEAIVFRSDSYRYYFAAHGRPSLRTDSLPGTINPDFTRELDQVAQEVLSYQSGSARSELAQLYRLAELAAGRRPAERAEP